MTESIALGSVIRGVRKARKLSQEALAYESGINRTFLSQIERGVRQPTVTTLYKLAHALDISASDLLATVEQILAKQADQDGSTNGGGAEEPTSLPAGFIKEFRPEFFDFLTSGDYDGAANYVEVKIAEAYLLGMKAGRKKKT